MSISQKEGDKRTHNPKYTGVGSGHGTSIRKVSGTHLVLHLAVGHQERTVNAKDGTLHDRILEVETGQVIADTNAIGDCEQPVVPVALAVVELRVRQPRVAYEDGP